MLKDEKIFEEAFDLIIRRHSDPGNSVTRDLIRHWRARSPDHEAAWHEAMNVHDLSGLVVQNRARSAARVRPAISRRTFLLASFGACVLAGPQVLVHTKADHMTSTAETQNIPLSDGSIISLGPDSAIAEQFTTTSRQIKLLEGMAFFNVAADPVRPFEAVVSGMTVTSMDTAFELSRDGDLCSVAVQSGLADVSTAGTSQKETLSNGECLTFDSGSLKAERSQRQPAQIASWRDGILVVDKEPISTVVARIGRWKRGRVMIADAGLGAQRISGVYNLENPLEAIEAAVQPLGGKVREISPWLTVISVI
ncbi:FecR domain-containing protein [Shewanella algae]|uniref:FecR family protein n=1 Tax=Shewanella algae TaxID=38313 RepID=UPI00313C9677